MHSHPVLPHATRYGVPLIRYVGVLCYVSDRKRKKGELRLPPQLKLILTFYGLLRGVRWFETDVSELPVVLILKGKAVQEETCI